MVILLVLLLLATFFMMVAMILSDALFRASTLHQDLIWRSTLFAVVLLPSSVMVQFLVPGIALPIRSWVATPVPLVQSSTKTPDTANPSSAQAHPEVLPREKPSLSLEPEKQLTISSKPPANSKPSERVTPDSELSSPVPVSRSSVPVETPSSPSKVVTSDPLPVWLKLLRLGLLAFGCSVPFFAGAY